MNIKKDKITRLREALQSPNTKIEIASQDVVDTFGAFPAEFLGAVFGKRYRGSLITDESSLWDFPTATNDRPAVFARIKKLYGVDVSDITSGKLISVFARIRGA